MAQAKVISVKSIPSTDRSRVGQYDWLVLYQVDAAPVTAILIRKDKIDDQIIQAEIKAHEQQVGAMQGKTFTL